MNVCGCSASPQNDPGSLRFDTSVLAFPSTIWENNLILLFPHWEDFHNKFVAHLKISSLAVSRIPEISHFELVEAKSQHPITRCTTKAPKSVPTGQRLTAVLARYLRWGHIYINVHRFIAVILESVAWISTWQREKLGDAFRSHIQAAPTPFLQWRRIGSNWGQWREQGRRRGRPKCAQEQNHRQFSTQNPLRFHV